MRREKQFQEDGSTTFHLSETHGGMSSIITDYLSSLCNLLSAVNLPGRLTSESRGMSFHIR